MTDATSAVIAACQTVTASYDGIPPKEPTAAHVIVYGGTGAPAVRKITTHVHVDRAAWRIVCVSNNPRGCRTLSARVTAAVDRLPLAGGRLLVQYVSDPLEDRNDPSEWRWTATVEATLYQPIRKEMP